MSPRRSTLALAVLLCLSGVARGAAPERVVSINLCTDQLAMLIAGDGQLVSVGRLAADPDVSNLADAASRLRLNAGSAEEIYLLDPDLVLAGTFTSPATVEMLRRLGVRVELFPPSNSLAETMAAMRRLGALFGREDRAEAVIAGLDAEILRLEAAARDLPREPAAFYFANSFTDGSGTLSDEILARANLDNAAATAGLEGSVRMPLEVLVMQAPLLVRTARRGTGAAAPASAALDHPALAAVAAARGEVMVEPRWQVCGSPFVARAIEALVAARR